MTLRAAAFVAFFLSGASSLVFQTLWSRLLSHVFGSSSIAVSSVVSVFMAGLGLGAYWFGQRADRLGDPLRLYAYAETAVGCIALIVPLLLRSDGFLSDVNAALRAQLGGSAFVFALARFACIFPILIVPTVLMGSTLPLLARHFVASASDAAQASRAVGRLYAVNTFGAVVGVFASSFILLPLYGVSVANTLAACTNFALAALVLGLRRATLGASRARAEPPVAAPAPAAVSDSREPEFPRALRVAAALTFAGSGFSSLLYEVVWSRALINTIGGSLYSFSLILTTFLVGIAGGSALFASLSEARVRPLAVAFVGACAACALVFPAWAVHGGVALASGAVLGSLLLTGAVAFFARAHLERSELFAGPDDRRAERSGVLALLMVPCASALAAMLQRADRLSAITLCVVCAGSAFLGLLLFLFRRPLALLIGLQLFIGLATLLSSAFADELSLTFASMVAPLYKSLPDHVGTVQACMFATSALCVLPAALGMGAVFPATLRVWSAGGGAIGKDVGLVYAGNTLGSIFGAWLPGFVLMPALGMQATLQLGILWNLASALGLSLVAAHCAAAGSSERRHLTLMAAGLPWLIGLVLFSALRPSLLLGWNISKMTLGAFRISLARDVLDQEAWGAPDLVYYRDGLSTTVTVERWGRHYSLKNNGKVDASNGDDMPTQIMVSALPILLHAKPADQLELAIVGFGSGVTVGAALQFPIKSLEVVELERSTVEGSRFFAEVNHLAYVSTQFPYVREPRLRVIDDDGRNYLAATRKRYDVIVSEPSNPWLTGVSDLFTIDHFRVAKRKLKPDGVYCQWAQLYELSPENVKILYRTFAESFRHVVVFSSEDLSSDTILIGSDAPLPLDAARLERGFRAPGVARELERAYVHAPEDVLARVLLSSRAEVARFTAGAPLNTDDNARIELAAPRDLIGFERYKGYLETMYAPSWPYGRLADKLVGFEHEPERYARLILGLLAHGRKSELPELLRAAHAQRGGQPSRALELAEQISAHLSDARLEPALPVLTDPAPPEADARTRAMLGEVAERVHEQLAAQRYGAALAQLERLTQRQRRSAGAAWPLLEGCLRYKAGDPDGAIDVFEELLRGEDGVALEHPELHYFLARAHDALLHFDKAVRNMRAYVAARGYPAARSELQLPEPPGAPASDLPGITPKEVHATR
jgi:spermidine synthase